jgi:hypothetical protein
MRITRPRPEQASPSGGRTRARRHRCPGGALLAGVPPPAVRGRRFGGREALSRRKVDANELDDQRPGGHPPARSIEHRRGDRVADGTRLLSGRTGNCSAGSTPALSANKGPLILHFHVREGTMKSSGCGSRRTQSTARPAGVYWNHSGRLRVQWFVAWMRRSSSRRVPPLSPPCPIWTQFTSRRYAA